MSEENFKEKDFIIETKKLEKDSKEVKEDDNKVENIKENNEDNLDDNNKKQKNNVDKITLKDKDNNDNENISELKISLSDKTDDIFSRKESRLDKVSDKEEEDNNEDEIEEENDEEDLDEDDDDDEDDDEDDDDKNDDLSYDTSRDKKKKDPYHAYINSKVDNLCYYINFEKGDYLYGIEQNKFYKVTNYIDTKKGNDKYEITLELIDNLKSKTKKGKLEMKKISENILYNSLSYEVNKKEEKEKDKKDEEKKNIENNNNQKKINNNIDISKKEENKKDKTDDNKNKEKGEKKEDDNNNNSNKENKEEENDNINIKKEDKNKNDKDNKEKNKDNQDNKKNESLKKNNSKKIIKEKASNSVTLTISLKDHSKYTYLQKIKIFYINYLNIYHKIEMLINMNASINELILKFLKLYHIPQDHYGEKNPLQIIINNKKYMTGNKIRKKYFIPINFDYKNDYIIILEKQNNYLYEVNLGTKTTYINLKGAKIPHFVYSCYYNYQLESFIISRNITQLECEIYELKKEAIFEINIDNEKNTKKKIKDFLDLNWKERANLITTIKSGNIKKSKENYDAICFEINRKFILTHGKSYVFLVTSLNKKIYDLQNKNISKEGLIIISKDDKNILNGFKVKKISDLGAY